ncbi:PAN 1 domain containing protein [Trichuris trichiura]|uniref:PAN 1 domain containing protein n=1 Tax=Trichuris trichiura TaxID=36087 RepID=A0A077Z8C3_TRITR|nr:PAN 1 domain containing protein [Trichuris trichiura]
MHTNMLLFIILQMLHSSVRIYAESQITYSKGSCPNGWKSNAVRDYMFIGRRAKLVIVETIEACLRQCYTTPTCKSVNIFRRVKCFLNESSQYDKPEMLVPLTGAVYYDSIHCTSASEYESTATLGSQMFSKIPALPLKYRCSIIY